MFDVSVVWTGTFEGKNNYKSKAASCFVVFVISKIIMNILIRVKLTWNGFSDKIKGMIRPIFCIDVNTHSDKKRNM